MLTKLRTTPIETPRRKRPGPIRARTGDDLQAFEAAWPPAQSQVCASAPSFDWLRAARIAFAESADLHVVAAERDGRGLAATALACVRRGISWRWVPLGSQLGEPLEIASGDPQALGCVVHALLKLPQPLHFQRVPARSPAINAIRRAARGRALVRVRPAEPAVGVELDESWIRPEGHLPAADRRQLTRARREAERLGSVSVEICAPDLRELPRLLDLLLLECDNSPLARTDEDAAANQLAQTVFLRQYAEAACIEGTLRIGVLRIADRVAAAVLGVESTETLWLLRVTANLRFASCRPETLVLREMLSYAAEANLRSCELWGASSAFLRAWPLVERPCVALSIYPLSIEGVIAAATDACTAAVRTVMTFARK